MANFPTISADTIASIGDPWVAEMQKRRLEGELSSLPRGPGGGIDYNAAALKIMPLNPFAAQQLIKMAGQQQTAGQHGAELELRRRALDIQQSAEDKPVIQEDPDSGYHYVFRPVSQQGRWLTGPNAGQQLNLGSPMPRMMPGTGAPRPQNTAPGGSSAPVPAPTPQPQLPAPAPSPPQQSQGGQVEVAPGVSLSQDEINALRQNPQAAKQFEAYYKLPPGTAQRLLGTGQRSEAGAETVPSETYPGGVARMAGPQVGEMAPEIGQAFGQATVPGGGGGGVDLAPTREDAPNLPMKNRRAIEEARQKEYYRKQADQQIKDIAAAENIEPYMPAARTAQRLMQKAFETGNIHPIWGNDLVTSGLKYARGALDIAGMSGANNPIQSPLITDPLRKSMAQLELLRAQAMKGQGAITEAERAILRRSLPTLDAANPEEALQQMQELMGVLERITQRGAAARRGR